MKRITGKQGADALGWQYPSRPKEIRRIQCDAAAELLNALATSTYYDNALRLLRDAGSTVRGNDRDSPTSLPPWPAKVIPAGGQEMYYANLRKALAEPVKCPFDGAGPDAVALWDEINRFADAPKMSGARMAAVAEIGRILRDAWSRLASAPRASDAERIIQAATHMDWGQVVLNNGSACFHIEEDGRFCGRSSSWAGHAEGCSQHLFEPLYVAITRAVKSLIGAGDAVETPALDAILKIEQQIADGDLHADSAHWLPVTLSHARSELAALRQRVADLEAGLSEARKAVTNGHFLAMNGSRVLREIDALLGRKDTGEER